MNVPESEKGQDEGQDEVDPEPALLIRLDEADALVHLRSMTVSSANETLRKRVESVVDMALTTVSSLSEMYSGSASSAAIVIKSVGGVTDTDAPEVDSTSAGGEGSGEK